MVRLGGTAENEGVHQQPDADSSQHDIHGDVALCRRRSWCRSSQLRNSGNDESLPVMVPTAEPAVALMVALLWLERVTLMVSSPSSWSSGHRLTVTVLDVSPELKVSVPRRGLVVFAGVAGVGLAGRDTDRQAAWGASVLCGETRFVGGDSRLRVLKRARHRHQEFRV